MHTRSRSTFTTIHSEGALLPVDLLKRILDGDKDLDGLSPGHYHLPAGEKLNEAVNRAWNRLQGAWIAFRSARRQLAAGDPGTGMTRERWLLPLFQELGYGRLPTSKAAEIEGKSYPISHQWDVTPIHLVGCELDLDKRAVGVAGAARTSPHSLVQEFLNRSEASTWGLVSNGLQLRLLRDNASLIRQAFVEFDLLSMFDGEIYSDFVVLWLVCHQSRFEQLKTAGGGTETNWLEIWSKDSQKRGTRALDQLRDGVEQAIAALGSGFLRYPTNAELRQKLSSGELDKQDYYRQLLRLVYRLIFLFAAEDRDLLFHPGATPQAKETYSQYYSTNRLRRLAERRRGTRHTDLWQGLHIVFNLLSSAHLPDQGDEIQSETEEGSGESRRSRGVRALGLPVLGGFLFSSASLPDLEKCHLDNQSLLESVRSLSFLVEKDIRRAVDYRNLGPEELGSIYESLLELHPQLNLEASLFSLTSAAGHERKTTGSYYTPTSLIEVLLDSALDPVIERSVQDAGPSSENQQSAILNLKICDPACGSGHFLIAASHRLARRLAQIQAGGDEPPPTAIRSALRSVIAHCIYGVDVNPMAVELCKVNLWLESLEPGKPLSFLDAHIQCGDSLVGVGPGLDISEIPDDAFKPVFGDDRDTSSALRKRNKAERSGQMGLALFVIRDVQDLAAWVRRQSQAVEAMPEETPDQVLRKARDYSDYLQSQQYKRRKLEADLWSAAFFWKIDPLHGQVTILAPTQEMLRRGRSGGSLPPELETRVNELASELKFFHWDLAFPHVFSAEKSGFDCVLGNPPWERIKLQEQEFFATHDPGIANAPNKAAREKLIETLTHANPTLALFFENTKHAAECVSKFARVSGRFPLTAVGDVNTYALFAELTRKVISSKGYSGIIVPTGIATDDTTKEYFSDLTNKRGLVNLYGFENTYAIFPGVHRNYKFCLFTTSRGKVNQAEFLFLATQVSHLKDHRRRFHLASTEIALFNPNTRTMPIFRNKVDAELIRKIYQNAPILIDESADKNPWTLYLASMFHMTNDSYLFRNEPLPEYVPLYEGKMIQQFDHRAASVIVSLENIQRQASSDYSTTEEHQNPYYSPKPRYWVPRSEVENRLDGYYFSWLIGFQDLTNPSTERIILTTLIPRVGVGNTVSLILLSKINSAKLAACLLQNFNSLVLDYVSRSKVGYLHLNFFIFKQFPVLPPEGYTTADIDFIVPRVLELVYTAYDMKPFADDIGYRGEPYRWDEERRALLRAEVDAYYARLYGLNHKQLRYILDPSDLTPSELEDILDPYEEVEDALDPVGYATRVAASDFPGETFRVLKKKEIRQFGEYRTRRLVLEAWERLQGLAIGNPNGYLDHVEERVSAQPVITNAPKKTTSQSAPQDLQPQLPEVEQTEIEITAQPTSTDYGIYKCLACGKMVIGFEKENHLKDVHKGIDTGYKKLR